MVYIHEAHASDVWPLDSNRKQNVVFASPRNMAERATVADACVRHLKIEIPALIDDFRNSTDIAYTGWPDRLYVIDRHGRIAYKSRPGPFGFRPQEMAKVLESLVEN